MAEDSLPPGAADPFATLVGRIAELETMVVDQQLGLIAIVAALCDVLVSSGIPADRIVAKLDAVSKELLKTNIGRVGHMPIDHVTAFLRGKFPSASEPGRH
jgi:uncharacterized membrane-anchored protein